jgi:hypothetical protein
MRNMTPETARKALAHIRFVSEPAAVATMRAIAQK